MSRLLVVAAFLVATLVAWATFVLSVAGGYWDPPRVWDFSKTGTLGDSFGIVSALMATAAAFFTLATLEHTRKQAAQREREEHERECERSLFQLMALRNELIEGISIKVGKQHLRGHQAIAHMATCLADELVLQPTPESYLPIYNRWRDELGHYFRFTYHIVLFVDRNLEPPKNYGSVRWLRAQLTNSEQILLALNCLYGEGRERFKELVEFYAMLHNIHPKERERLSLDLLFAPTAFDPPPPTAPPRTSLERFVAWTISRLIAWTPALATKGNTA